MAGYHIPTRGPVTPREIYYLLRAKGYTTNQAIGIMANMINESGLDPEAVAPGGASYGLVQMTPGSYPGASNLVTGDAQRDVRAQVNSLAAHVSPHSGAVAGNTPSEVAGNFASRFERCAGCQPGQQQWNGRRANAAMVSRWVTGGHWPIGNVKGGANNPGGGGAANSQAQTATCLISAPKFAFIGGGCIFAKTHARALIGGLLIASGGLVTFVGLGVLVAGAFSSTKAGQAAGKAVGRTAETVGAGVALVPGAEAAGAGIAATGKGVKGVSRRAGQRRGQRATDERRLQRAVGEPRENPDLRVGRGAVRESAAGTRRRAGESGQARARRLANASSNGGREKVPF